MTGRRVDTEERQRIVGLLRAGLPIGQVCELVKRSPTAVCRIRDDEGIPPHAAGCPPKVVQPTDLDDEEDADNDAPHVDAVFVERPNQQQWLTVVAAAADDPEEQRRLFHDVRRALGLGKNATEAGAAAAAMQDPRTADQLAALYLAARRTRRYR